MVDLSKRSHIVRSDSWRRHRQH